MVTSARKTLVDIVANFIADVLEHPRIQTAAASSIVAGMNATADQPDLPERAATIYLKLQEQNEHVSRQLGEQFPKVAGAFLAGAAAGLRKKEPQKDEQSTKAEGNDEGNDNKPASPSRPAGHWGSLFRSLHPEENTNNGEVEFEVYENSTNFPLLSIGSFHSCSDGLELDKLVKDKRS